MHVRLKVGDGDVGVDRTVHSGAVFVFVRYVDEHVVLEHNVFFVYHL